jgi:hypothetical protein
MYRREYPLAWSEAQVTRKVRDGRGAGLACLGRMDGDLGLVLLSVIRMADACAERRDDRDSVVERGGGVLRGRMMGGRPSLGRVAHLVVLRGTVALVSA